MLHRIQASLMMCSAQRPAIGPKHIGVIRSVDILSETMTELIIERAGPVTLKMLLLGPIAFRPFPLICPARRAKPENH